MLMVGIFFIARLIGKTSFQAKSFSTGHTILYI